MSVPEPIRAEVMEKLAKNADEAGWLALSAVAKSRFYANWTKDPNIGGRLSRYLEPAAIRHYIKDALMKPYARSRRADPAGVLALLGIPAGFVIQQSWIKPHGCELVDGRVVCWGRAETWKLVLMAVFERSYGRAATRPHGALLTQSAAHFASEVPRKVVNAAAAKLGIEKVVWRLD